MCRPQEHETPSAGRGRLRLLRLEYNKEDGRERGRGGRTEPFRYKFQVHRPLTSASLGLQDTSGATSSSLPIFLKKRVMNCYVALQQRPQYLSTVSIQVPKASAVTSFKHKVVPLKRVNDINYMITVEVVMDTQFSHMSGNCHKVLK